MSLSKTLLKKIYLALPVMFREQVRFRLNVGYVPSPKHPVTFNEKILYRKLFWTNPLFPICADKVEAKAHVAGKHADLVVLENLAEGPAISFGVLKNIVKAHGDIVLKTNHDSGAPCFLGHHSTDEELVNACSAINERLRSRFGELQCEAWYSQINPKFLIEKRIEAELGKDLSDYKFHVFRKGATHQPKVILQVDFERFTNHTRSFFDTEMNWLPFSVRYPAVYTTLEKPRNFDRMLEIAKDLAAPFSYARIDLFNSKGEIYFGEITFAHESGRGRFSDKLYDEWMGKWWTDNPSL